jgi:formate dehydrogenase major subunit
MRVAIDGVELEVQPGTTVLEAVELAGGSLPTLCYDDRLAPFGACRTCLVGLEGASAPVPACTTRCREGMRIDTRDAAVTRVVRTVVELVLSELERPPGPDTELARVAASLGLDHSCGPQGGRFEGATHEVDLDERHPYLAFQHELCISCARCVRACDEIQGAFALTATGRGFDSNVTAGLDSGFQDSTCVSCGACADTCPTGAIIERRLLTLERERDDGRAA